MRRWLLMMLVMGCSSPGGSTMPADAAVDGNPSDAGPDSGSPVVCSTTEGVGNVRVNALINGASPQKVFFSNPDGTLELETTADANGVVVGNGIASGSSVTAVFTSPGFAFFTLECVQPGDDIDLRAAPPAPTLETFSISFPPHPNHPFVTYKLRSYCGGPSDVMINMTSGTLGLQPGCPGQTIDIWVTASTAADGSGDYLEVLGVPYTNGGSVTINSAWQPMPHTQVEISNVPAVGTAGFSRQFSTSGANADGPWTFYAPPTSTALFNAALIHSPGTTSSTFEVFDGGDIQFDVAGMLPFMSATFDQPSESILIPPFDTNAEADVLFTGITYVQDSKLVLWSVTGPYRPAVALPEVPADIGMDRPAPSTTVTIGEARIIESSLFASYNEVRAYPAMATQYLRQLPHVIGAYARESGFRP